MNPVSVGRAVPDYQDLHPGGRLAVTSGHTSDSLLEVVPVVRNGHEIQGAWVPAMYVVQVDAGTTGSRSCERNLNAVLLEFLYLR